MGIRSIGGTLVRVTTYNGAAMRKHGGDRLQPQDKTLAALDALAHATHTPRHGTGFIVRRKAAAS